MEYTTAHALHTGLLQALPPGQQNLLPRRARVLSPVAFRSGKVRRGEEQVRVTHSDTHTVTNTHSDQHTQ